MKRRPLCVRMRLARQRGHIRYAGSRTIFAGKQYDAGIVPGLYYNHEARAGRTGQDLFYTARYRRSRDGVFGADLTAEAGERCAETTGKAIIWMEKNHFG